jgi:hypothetical protein
MSISDWSNGNIEWEWEWELSGASSWCGWWWEEEEEGRNGLLDDGKGLEEGGEDG